MAYTADVKYWKLTNGGLTQEPYASTMRELRREMDWRNTYGGYCEAWCKTCGGVVDIESKVNAQGMYNVCANCGSAIDDQPHYPDYIRAKDEQDNRKA